MMMMMPKVHQSSSTSSSSSSTQAASLLVSSNSFLSSHRNTSIPIRPPAPTTTTTVKKTKAGSHGAGLRVNAISNPFTALKNKNQTVEIKAVVHERVILGGLSLKLTEALDNVTDLLGTSILLELVSAEAKDGSEGERVEGYARKISQGMDEYKYECTFHVPPNFGELGAIVVENRLRSEIYIDSIVLTLPQLTVTVPCSSFVHSMYDNPQKRVFFTNKSYLPSQTPSGIKKLREQDLQDLRGTGEGERQTFDRIYDYDKYNDLGSPDSSDDLARPVLGGSQHPYPRRCRTGRAPTKKDPSSESRGGIFYTYVPRDENFSAVKETQFLSNTVGSVFSSLLPTLETTVVDTDLGFPHFTRIDSLFEQGVPLPKDEGIFKLTLPRLIKKFGDAKEDVLLFETPDLMDRDRFAWNKDEEFSRQTLAGLNPFSIQLVTEWPLKSALDPCIYGTAQSAITKEIVEKEIKGEMTLEEALATKKLFLLDYHDLLLPYVQKVRELDGTTLYGSRTLFFKCGESTLRPIAIELTRPPIGDKPLWRHVFTPCWDATNAWLWKFAKAHVTAHDSGYHQLVIHWLRTHCCTEPYIIAANRQLSAMHPVYRLLNPHFRYTMEINGLAREALINANGVIESAFSPGKYSMELSSAAYDLLWRFDTQALPADLIRRGMAVEDPRAEHGLELTIKDYPFANDGLILWDAIKSWVSDYVNHYYPDSQTVEADTELQGWWTEVRTKGHEDKKDEPWWPVLNTVDSLIQTLSTIIWVTSGHHAAVNFGQYDYAGYFPNRPTIARTNVPNEDPDDLNYKNFLTKPEATLLQCFPSQIQATKVMAILDVLSSHSPDEEYIGAAPEPSWAENPTIDAAFQRFVGKLKELDGIIDERNADPKLRNRYGAGVVPYELLKPDSASGVTARGVPNSISI